MGCNTILYCYLNIVFDNLKSNVLDRLLNSEIQFRLIVCYLMLHTRECEGDTLFFFLAVFYWLYALELLCWEPRKLFPSFWSALFLKKKNLFYFHPNSFFSFLSLLLKPWKLPYVNQDVCKLNVDICTAIKISEVSCPDHTLRIKK